MTARTSGLELCEAFFRAEVAPAMAAELPGLPYAAGVLGRGSEVLGYDDAMSTDHTWFARTTLFVPEDALAEHGDDLRARLAARLPEVVDGVPTEIAVTTVRDCVRDQLGLDTRADWDAYDWVSLPPHLLCAMTAGAVFHDDLDLGAVRARLAYYPDDVWRFLLHAGWWRVHPELNLVGRAGSVGDDLGSRVIATDMVAGLMRLAFLVERRYPPYRKWLGTAFGRLPVAADLAGPLRAALHAATWQEREAALCSGYTVLAEAFDALGITPPLTLEPVRMWDRPFTVMWADFPGALRASVQDPQVLALIDRWPTGGVDQVPDLLFQPAWRTRVRDLLEG